MPASFGWGRQAYNAVTLGEGDGFILSAHRVLYRLVSLGAGLLLVVLRHKTAMLYKAPWKPRGSSINEVNNLLVKTVGQW